ncbi:hypothetical protein ACN27G_14990 [Plantactinospora sp. WMMB334]|uniref:hypothetical protein n=1 Tax=Plantactinospora sp. WMMB334 TaxID=3404119 RepID=UPI003B93317A
MLEELILKECGWLIVQRLLMRKQRACCAIEDERGGRWAAIQADSDTGPTGNIGDLALVTQEWNGRRHTKNRCPLAVVEV